MGMMVLHGDPLVVPLQGALGCDRRGMKIVRHDEGRFPVPPARVLHSAMEMPVRRGLG